MLTYLSAKWEESHVLSNCVSRVLQSGTTAGACQWAKSNRAKGNGLHLQGIFIHSIHWEIIAHPKASLILFTILLYLQTYLLMPIAHGCFWKLSGDTGSTQIEIL